MANVEPQLKLEDPGPLGFEQAIYNHAQSSREQDVYNREESPGQHHRFEGDQPIYSTTLEATPVPSEGSPQAHSHEDSPHSDEKEHVREWYEGYRPAKRRKKTPRPGESTFRVPMSMEQRKSLGASVRPKASQVSAYTTTTPPASRVAPLVFTQAENPIVPATRGGTKLKFRAYGSAQTPIPTPSRKSTASQSSPVSLSPQQLVSEQTPNHYYSVSTFSQSSHDFNFPAAPLENNTKLAWWLAQQIGQTIPRINPATNPQVAEIPASQFYGNEESMQVRKRQTDRERKARWRENNVDKNRDNDLRARVNRQARLKFGVPDTPTKSAWIESEILRRRVHRDDTQVSQAAKSGHFPSFSNTENIRASLLKYTPAQVLHPSEHKIKRLVVDVLFPAHGKDDTMNRHQSLQILAQALGNKSPQDDELFRAAFSMIAENEVALETIKSTMKQFVMDEDEELDFEGFTTFTGYNNSSESPSNHVVLTLNKALKFLRELNELGQKQQAVLAKVPKIKDGPRKPSQREHRQHLKDFGMSESQLEDFLVIVNGGPLEPESDDDLAVELFGNDLEIEVPQPSGPQTVKIITAPDASVWDLFNSVLETLLERYLMPPKRGRRAKKSLVDENGVKDRANKVKQLLIEIGVRNGQGFSGVESQAISEFCHRLKRFIEIQSFGGNLLISALDGHRADPPASSEPFSKPEEPHPVHERRYTNDVPAVGLSPAAPLPLPDATNPFADDEMEISPPLRNANPPEFVPTQTSASTGHVQTLPPLPPPSPVEPQIQSYSNYPQFRPVNSPTASRR